MEKILGTIQRIVYSNPENGYAVVVIKLDYSNPEIKKYKDYLISNLLTVTCYYDRLPIKGEIYEYTGEFVDGKYGLQLKSSSFNRPQEDSLQAVVTYLSSDMFPGVGKVVAAKIYNELGNNCLKKIKKDIKVLDKVSGLSAELKEMIYQTLIENEKKEKEILNFIEMGFTMAMAKKIQQTLTKKEIKEVFENPYILMEKVEGIGFLRADKIALAIGVKKDSPLRLKACILYILNSNIYETGNTYIEKNILKNNVLEILNREEELISNQLFDELLFTLQNDGKILVDEKELVYDLLIHHSEESLATSIVSMIKSDPIQTYELSDIKKAFETVKKENKIEYTPTQEKAIIAGLNENIVIITGGPGTGKTTIVKGIIKVYHKLNPKCNILEDISLLAPTGRAGKRLNEVTGHIGQTIHKFLGYDGKRYLFGANNKVTSKMVIIDEMSMVDVVLASRLFSSLPATCKVVIVGDVDQIPSVAPGEVLADLIKTKEITTIKLDKIHRQAQDSSIITLAHHINNGIVPENIIEKQHDRNFIYLKEEDILENIEVVIRQAINKGMNLLHDIQVLIPMYRGELGIDNCNAYLQNIFNPLNEGEDEVIALKQRFRINDKVIQLINRNEDQIMNGDIGQVICFEKQNNQIVGMTVQFENRAIDYIKEEYEQLKLAYVISIHKSQGSEFTTVVIPFSKRYYPMLKRRLYYTAITRAKKYLIMLGDIEPLKIAAQSTGYARKTKLQDLIKKLMSDDSLSPYDF